MSKEDDNKALVGRWFTDFWGENCDLQIVDELAAPDMLLQYSLHEPRRGHAEIKAFMTGFPRSVSKPRFHRRCRSHRRGRLCGRSMDRRRHPYRTGVQRFPDGIVASIDWKENAIYRNDGATDRQRQDHRRNRSGRRRDSTPATRPHTRCVIAITRLVNLFVFNAFGSRESITRARRSKTSRKRSEVLILDDRVY